MDARSETLSSSGFRRLPVYAAAVMMAEACLVLIGWAFGIAALREVISGLPPMAPLTAFTLIFAAASLWLGSRAEAGWGYGWRNFAAQFLACSVLVAALLALSQYVFSVQTGIDRLFFPGHPAQISPHTAIAFLFGGSALLLLATSSLRKWSQVLAMLMLAAVWLALVGYIYRVRFLYGISEQSGMSPLTVFAFIMLGLGLLSATAEMGLMQLLFGESVGGVMARRLLPAAVLIPIVLGWLRMAGQRAELYDLNFGITLTVVTSTFMFVALIWLNARQLQILDRKRSHAEAQLREANDGLERRVIERTADLHRTNADLQNENAERRRTEQALSESENRLQRALRAAKMDAFEADLVTGRVRRTENAMMLLGLGIECTTEEFFQLIHPEDLPRFMLLVQSFAPERDRYQIEYRVIRPDGETAWLSEEAEVSFDEQGRPIRVAGVIVDVTARKEADSALRESVERFHALVDVSAQIVWTADVNGAVVEDSPSWRAFTGQTYEQWKGRGWLDALHPDDRVSAEELWRAAVAEKSPVSTEYRLRHVSGEWRWTAVRAVPLFRPNGSVYEWVGMNQDITERKQAEEALRESQARLAGLIESAMDGIITANTEQRIVLFNAAAEKMFGVPASEAIGQPLWRFIPERFRAAHEHHIHSFGEAGVTSRAMGALGAVSGLRSNGEEFPIEASISQIEVAGERLYTVILRDITERMRAEAEREELLNREKLLRAQAETANRLKDEFLATVSHELRTPLNHIFGWVTLLRAGKLSADEVARALETIERNARAQKRLIEDLLDVSRIITGKLRLDVRLVEPEPIIRAAVEAVRPAAEAKEIRLQVILDPYVDRIPVDPDRLQQIVWNLVFNAIKFTPRGGRVQVQIERIKSQVEIAVSDTGQGIKPEFLPYVFERFRQEDASSTRRYGGLGLGLAIVRHLTELHGGSVSVDSPGEGQGATFKIRLPLTIADTIRAETVGRHPAIGGGIKSEDLPKLDGLKVLAVDDEPDARELLKAILEPAGALVRTAGGMREALDAIDQWPPDVLVSDIGMPNGDGYDLIRAVRKMESSIGRKMQAVALTAYARAEDRMRALASGYQMHVGKPVEPAELIAVLASLSERLDKRK
jgi:PAS domain S-box-containing protein